MSGTQTAVMEAKLAGSDTCLKSSNDLIASFNFYASPDKPDISEIASIFGGTSRRLKAVPCPETYVISPSAAASSVPDFFDNDYVQERYWPELTTALRSQLGLRSAIAMNTTTRDVRPETTAREINHLNPREDKKSLGGFFVVHGDYSPAGGRAHLRHVLPTFFDDTKCLEPITTPEERTKFFQLWNSIQAAEQQAILEEQGGTEEQHMWAWSGRNYTGPRWAIFSVWRPLEVVQSDPMGIMDARSFFSSSSLHEDGDQYVIYDRTYKDRPGFTSSYRSENILPIAPSATAPVEATTQQAYRFFWVPDQTPEEIYVLKLFDSEAQTIRGRRAGVVECAPHSAFTLPDQDGKPARRSVEVRVFAIW
ncbi:uncharacterized protein AB675_2110 [Cyphellophora attinorum]|uniref:Uncharacterized protein n=1 Tax=Cyphellophora attinorum TaxID=1664694 RepID=A0A0N0NPL1_9EURO|nr:uncharacterized protein AB675_2110 [Phialophora attinorum]KPI42848.1 hypothetical protein AB675_2110 [Phialophora attinorum]